MWAANRPKPTQITTMARKPGKPNVRQVLFARPGGWLIAKHPMMSVPQVAMTPQTTTKTLNIFIWLASQPCKLKVKNSKESTKQREPAMVLSDQKWTQASFENALVS